MSYQDAKSSSVETNTLKKTSQSYNEKIAETQLGIDMESFSKGEDNGLGELVLEDARDITTHVITIEDDPSLNPWTFRAFFLGIGLSAFGGVLGKCASRHLFPLQ